MTLKDEWKEKHSAVLTQLRHLELNSQGFCSWSSSMLIVSVWLYIILRVVYTSAVFLNTLNPFPFAFWLRLMPCYILEASVWYCLDISRLHAQTHAMTRLAPIRLVILENHDCLHAMHIPARE